MGDEDEDEDDYFQKLTKYLLTHSKAMTNIKAAILSEQICQVYKSKEDLTV